MGELMMFGGELRVLEHDLIGLDGNGAYCSCGISSPNRAGHLEHLADVALKGLDAPPSADERREAKYRDVYQRRLERQAAIVENDAARARRVLAELQAEHERRWEQLDATGLDTFLDRSRWLAAHRTAEETRAARIRWRRRVEAAKQPGAVAYLRPHTDVPATEVIQLTERRTA